MKADRGSASCDNRRFHFAWRAYALTGCVLLAASACRIAPTQTNLLLDVEVAQPLTSQVDRVGVYGEPWQSAPDLASAKSTAAVALRDGNVPPFVLIPGPRSTELQVLIVAWHGDQRIAWAVFKSAYAAGADRFLTIKLGCSGGHDLGVQSSDSAPPTTAIDACKFSAPSAETDAGSPDDAGRAGGSPAADGGGRSAAGVGGGSTPPPRAGAGAGGHAGHAGHAADGGAGAAGDAGMSTLATGASGGDSGSGGAGSGGSAVGGAGGNAGSAAGGAGSGGTAGTGGSASDCYKWVPVDITAPPDVTSVSPGFDAGTDTRASEQPIPNYVCLGASSSLSGMQVGKASEWGCYVPGSGMTEDTDMSFQLLEAPMGNSCLVWRPLDSTSSAPPNNLKYQGMTLPTPICRVEHDGVDQGVSTTGKRVGQLRQENGVWVCRFEFYIADNNGHTLVNDGGQVPEVLDLAP